MFTTAPYFKPIGTSSWTIDSLDVNDTVYIPISLLFLDKQQSDDEQTYYPPSVTWTSNGTAYLGKHYVLVDFQNTDTRVAQAVSTVRNKYEMYSNYPNPFNPLTTIKYDLPEQSKVKLVIYNVLEIEVASLADETEKAGSYQAVWNASRFARGVYSYRLQACDYSTTKKLLLLK